LWISSLLWKIFEEFSNLGNDLKWPCSKQKIKCSLTYLILNCKFKFPFIYLYKIQPYLQLQKDHNLYYYLIVKYQELEIWSWNLLYLETQIMCQFGCRWLKLVLQYTHKLIINNNRNLVIKYDTWKHPLVILTWYH
jgi:hypothetical protein